MDERALLLDLIRDHVRRNDPGSPTYYYSREILKHRVRMLSDALPPNFQILYSLKANPFPPVLKELAVAGLGADVSSGGELQLARAAGFKTISFCGPGKTKSERVAALSGADEIYVAESLFEVREAESYARAQGKRITLTIRVQPARYLNAAGRTVQDSPSAFGISEDQIPEVVAAAGPHVRIGGLHVHTGSMYFSSRNIAENFATTLGIAIRLRELTKDNLDHVNFGGGLAIPYKADQASLDLVELRKDLGRLLESPPARPLRDAETKFYLESGRYLIGPAGAYVTPVLVKKISFGQTILVTDGGMNHHLAATGYGQALRSPFPMATLHEGASETVRVVGSSCYGMDVLADRINLPGCEPGDRIVIFQSGAYGASFSMGNFLSKPAVAEVLL